MENRAEKKGLKRLVRKTEALQRTLALERAARREELDWWFVLPLFPGESPSDPAGSLQVQYLDSDGAAKSVTTVARTAAVAFVDGIAVPTKVLEAGRQLPVGFGGIYVNSEGQPLSAHGAPIDWPPIPTGEELAARILEGAERLRRTGVPGWKIRLSYVVSHFPNGPAALRAQHQLDHHGDAG
jgi:hypothetical protein